MVSVFLTPKDIHNIAATNNTVAPYKLDSNEAVSIHIDDIQAPGEAYFNSVYYSISW